jgi:hypothetical protein
MLHIHLYTTRDRILSQELFLDTEQLLREYILWDIIWKKMTIFLEKMLYRDTWRTRVISQFGNGFQDMYKNKHEIILHRISENIGQSKHWFTHKPYENVQHLLPLTRCMPNLVFIHSPHVKSVLSFTLSKPEYKWPTFIHSPVVYKS